jgi:IS30 family transposase
MPTVKPLYPLHRRAPKRECARKWSAKEIRRLRQLRDKGYGAKEIAAQLGRTVGAVTGQLLKERNADSVYSTARDEGRINRPYEVASLADVPQITPEIHQAFKDNREPTAEEEAANEAALAAACEQLRKLNGFSPFPQR